MDDSPALIVILLVGVLVVAAVVCSNVLPQVSEDVVEYKEAQAVQEGFEAVKSVAMIGQIQAASNGISSIVTSVALVFVVIVLALVVMKKNKSIEIRYLDGGQNHKQISSGAIYDEDAYNVVNSWPVNHYDESEY